MHTEFWWENLKEIYNFLELDIEENDLKINLREICKISQTALV